MSVAKYKTNYVTQDINRYINRWLGAGITAAQIVSALNTAATNLGALGTAPTKDRTITDTGALLNPTQPRTV